MKQVLYFFNQAMDQDPQKRLPALFALTLLNLEMQRLNLPFLDQEMAVVIFRHLRALPGAGPYLSLLGQWGTKAFDYKTLSTLLEATA